MRLAGGARVSVLEFALIVAGIALPFHFFVRRELEKLSDPAHLRTQGVVIVSTAALDARAAPIGTYMGQAIWESVTFKGMRFRYVRVVVRRHREAL